MTSRGWTLADRDIRRWALAGGVSQVGDQVWLVALAWTAVRLGGAGLAGLAMAAASLPRAALMLLGGALADRVSVRRLMLSCDVARGLVLLAGFLVLQRLGPSGALLIAIGLCFGVADAAYTPASNSLPVQLVSGDRLIALAGIRQLIGRGALLAGAPLGGAIVAVGGLQAALLVDTGSFVLIAVVLLQLRPRFPRRARVLSASLFADVRSGLAYVRRVPPVRDLTIALSGLNVFVTPVIAIGLAQHASQHGWGSGRLGILTGLIGAGAALGTLTVLRWRPRQSVRTGLLVLLVQAAALAILGVAPFAAAVAGTVTIGVTAGIASALLSGAFQQTVDQEYLGRCNGLVSVSDAALLPLALVLFGWLASHTGLAVSCASFGLGFAALLSYSIMRVGSRGAVGSRRAPLPKAHAA